MSMTTSDLIHRPTEDLSVRTLSRPARAAVQRSSEQSLVIARRIQDTAFVGGVALISVAGLSQLQMNLELQNPAASARLNLIADTATAAIAAQLLPMGRCC